MADIPHNAKFLATGIKAALDRKFTVADYLKKTKGHSPEQIAAVIAAVQAETDALP